MGAKQFAVLGTLFRGQRDIAIHANDRRGIDVGDEQTTVTLYPIPEEPQQILSGSIEHLFTCKTSELKAELEIATDFCSKTTSVPLFTGVRLVAAGERVGIMAYDGYSCLYLASIPATVSQQFDVTIQSYDLSTGLQLVGSENVDIGRSGPTGRVTCVGDDAVFTTTSLAGAWPNLKGLMVQGDRHTVRVPAEYIRAASTTAKSFLADNTLTVSSNDFGTVLSTAEAEVGRFECVVGGSLPGGVRATFDITHLSLAARLGEELVLHIAQDPALPTLVRSNSRQVWIARRLS